MDRKYSIVMSLKDGQIISSNDLATRFNVSSRTIKNDISEINLLDRNLIISLKQGYKLNESYKESDIDAFLNSLEETQYRHMKIAADLLLVEDVTTSLYDVYELCEKYYISLTTLKRDIKKINDIISIYKVLVKTKGDKLSIEGDEQDIRRVISFLYSKEITNQEKSLDNLQLLFPEYQIDTIKQIIDLSCKKFHYYVNGYSMYNLILDIVISIRRIKSSSYTKKSKEITQKESKEYSIAKYIAKQFEKEFDIVYTEAELLELTAMLMSYILKINFSSVESDDLEEFVGRDCINLSKKLIYSIEPILSADVRSHDFYIKFTMHIHNLLIRVDTGYIKKNPLTDNIKIKSSMMFELGVHIANELYKIKKIKITDDEIAYIALHLGGILDEENQKHNKIKVAVVIPKYYDFSDLFIRKIDDNFSAEMNIVGIFEVNQVPEANIEMIISTIELPIQLRKKVESMILSPLLPKDEIREVKTMVEKVQRKKQADNFIETFKELTSSKLIKRNMNFQNATDIIFYLTQFLVEENCVEYNFVDEVLKREKLSSTAYDKIAIPHALEMSAKRTAMVILVNKKEIDWFGKSVNIVILFCVNKQEISLFRMMFQELIEVLDEKTVNEAIDCESYSELIDLLYNVRLSL